MSTVSYVLAVAVKDGESESFHALMEEMVEHTRGEPGALAYEWFVSGDGKAVLLYERYQDSDAAMLHSRGFEEHFAERFLAAVDPTAFYVYGEPDEALQAALEPMGAQFYGPYGGFAR